MSSNFRYTSLLFKKKLHWKDQILKYELHTSNDEIFILQVTYLNLYFVQKKQKISYLSHEVIHLYSALSLQVTAKLFKSIGLHYHLFKREECIFVVQIFYFRSCFLFFFSRGCFQISIQHFEYNLFSPTQEHSMQNP